MKACSRVIISKGSAMSPCESLTDWITTVSSQMPHLSRPQARVLALWSYGMVVAQSCGLTTVATVLGLLLHQSPLTLRQRLREWCYAAADKKGRCRQEVPVAACFGPLLRWVLAWWPAEERRLMLAMDATTLGQRCAGDQRGLPRLCPSRGLDGRGSTRE